MTDEQINALIDDLVEYINRKVDIPLLSEHQEDLFFRFILHLVFSFLLSRKGKKPNSPV